MILNFTISKEKKTFIEMNINFTETPFRASPVYEVKL